MYVCIPRKYIYIYQEKYIYIPRKNIDKKPCQQWERLLLTYAILARVLQVASDISGARTAAISHLNCVVLKELVQPDTSKHFAVEL